MKHAASMNGSAVSKTSAFQSQFDPIELLGSQVRFVDPFPFNDSFTFDDDFEDCGAGNATGVSIQKTPSPAAVQVHQGPFTPGMKPDESAIVQRTPSLPLTGPVMFPEQLEVRSKLTSDQAIHIYKLGKTKTSSTAALLSAEFGITPKAIRDIWTHKSWVATTRLYASSLK